MRLAAGYGWDEQLMRATKEVNAARDCAASRLARVWRSVASGEEPEPAPAPDFPPATPSAEAELARRGLLQEVTRVATIC